MRLLFVFCCLSAGCLVWTEASPFFFNLLRTSVPSPQTNTQTQRQSVASENPGAGLQNILSKWFPQISGNKQMSSRRPKTSQRPTVAVPMIDKEVESLSTKVPEENIDNLNVLSTTTTSEQPIDEVTNYSSTTLTIEESSFVKETSTSTTTTITTTTPVPFEEIAPFTESKTSTMTTQLPFEETEPNFSTTFKVPEEKPSTTFSITEVYLSTTPKGPGQSTEGKLSTTTTTKSSFHISEVHVSTTAENPEQSTEGKISSTTTTGYPSMQTESFSTISTTTEAFKPFTEIKTSTSKLPPMESVTTQLPIDEIAFTTEQYSSSTSTSLTEPNIDFVTAGSNKEERVTINPTTYRPVYVTTTSTANPIDTEDIVEPSKPHESYFYVRPAIVPEEIVLNEVSANARPFENLSIIGTIDLEDFSQGTNKSDVNNPFNIDERPRITFYSNYYKR